jgi:hypothetical protein
MGSCRRVLKQPQCEKYYVAAGQRESKKWGYCVVWCFWLGEGKTKGLKHFSELFIASRKNFVHSAVKSQKRQNRLRRLNGME